jgi:hypothetical protein
MISGPVYFDVSLSMSPLLFCCADHWPQQVSMVEEPGRGVDGWKLQGRPFQAQLEDLAVGGQDDPVVRASLAALPQQLADEVSGSRSIGQPLACFSKCPSQSFALRATR